MMVGFKIEEEIRRTIKVKTMCILLETIHKMELLPKVIAGIIV